MFKQMTIAAALLAVPIAGFAQDSVRTERVSFARGATAKTITGAIRGYNSVDYVVGVTAGQKMTVTLKTSNPSSYFNITAPGADAALFVGSSSGNSYSFRVPSTGDYVVNVYLMRNAARRNEVANYRLTVGATR